VILRTLLDAVNRIAAVSQTSRLRAKRLYHSKSGS
jgi:hypothetical protein